MAISEVRFTRHAKERARERGLSLPHLQQAALRSSGLLTRLPMQVKLGDITIVAKKNQGEVITLVSAWSNDREKEEA